MLVQYSERIEWHSEKATANLKKHRVSFEEAATVLESVLTEWQLDLEHGEPRLNALGFSARGRVLFVVALEVVEDTFRIISARRATPAELEGYGT